MALDPSMRAGDADRDAVAERLRDAHADGRLTIEEFQQRLDAAFAARTLGELVPLTADLPVQGGRRPSSPRGAPDRQQVDRQRRPSGQDALRAAWTAWAVIVAINVTIWVLVSLTAGDPIYFWPMWVAGPWGAVLLITTLATRSRSR